MRHKGRLLLRANPGLIHALERRNLVPANPWMTNSGYVDRIAVESERMLDVYRKAGFPEQQLVLTGSCADDLLHAVLREKEARRDALCRDLGLPNDRPILLSALVPDQLGSGVPCCEFADYAALVEFWVKTLAAWAHKMNVVLKINPRYRREEFLYLEQWGATVAPHDTIELVPLAEVYVTSISSTLRWAAACGIPSINYDVYHYRYGDFTDVAGIVHVEKKAEFSAAVARLVTDEAHRAQLRRLQRGEAQSWGRLDGKSMDRLVSLFDELGTGSLAHRFRASRGASPQVLQMSKS
jgi:glycosyltransferase involved in cell wall biosynthesis